MLYQRGAVRDAFDLIEKNGKFITQEVVNLPAILQDRGLTTFWTGGHIRIVDMTRVC